MAYNTNEERLLVKGSEQITRDLKVNRDAFINGKAETGSIDDKGDLKVAGEILAGDDVTISGDLYVNGTEYINNSETAQTTDDYLVLRHNQTTPLGTNEYSGVAVHNYATGKTATITTDKDGTWRVADNTETDTNYTNISYYNGTYYTGLTRTATTVISGMKTAFDEDELDESVYYNNSYYHFDGSHWFPVSLSSNKLTLGSAVTSTTTINALNALTKHDLVYFRTLTITVINPVENQPLLTRAEASDLTGGQALTWDATNQKAVGKTIDTTATANSSNLITSGAVVNAINALDVASVGGDTKYISAISETNGKISATAKDVAQTYSSTGTTAASGKAIAAAIGTLDVASVGGTNKYISAISETDGKISATDGTIDTTVTASSSNLITSGAVKTAIDNAVGALDVTSVGGDGKYISAISETNGKISATSTTMDTSPTASSTKAVTSGGVATAIGNCNSKITIEEDTNIPTFVDATTIHVNAEGTNPTSIKTRTALNLWNYIKGKISSVLGLTSTAYGGKATTAGTADVSYNTYSLNKVVTCDTAAATAAKTVSLTGFSLNKGAKLIVNLSKANTVASALTLNVNNTGAKTIRWNGSVTSNSTYAMPAGYYNCYYDGTYWNMDNGCEAFSARTASGCSGNSSTADTTRGTAYCTTAAATAAKVASMRGYVLQSGATFPITFTNANSAASALTLAVNGTTAKPIYINNGASSSTNYTLPAGTYLCRYNGTNYYIDTSYAVTQARNCDFASQADYSRSTAYCATAAGTAAKTASMRGYVLSNGIFPITFTTTNTVAGALTLNINNTGAKPIYINGTASSSSNHTLPAGTYLCIYNGTSYNISSSLTSSATVTGVKGNNEATYRTGNVNITKANIGLGSVVDTGDSATPASGGTTKFTTGGAYNFFGGNTTASAWLGKVFGWALGRNWTQGTGLNTSYTFNTVYYANGIWVAGSNSHGLWYSTDGKAWVQGTGSMTSYSFYTVYYANGIWVAGSNNKYGLWWSTDGKAWTQVTGSTTSYTFNSVYHANNIWVACSDKYGLWYSTDGKAWSAGTGSMTSYYFSSVYYAKGIWVAGSNNEHGLWYSTDGKAWTQVTGSTTSYSFYTVYYANGIWIAGSSSHGVWWSTDGKTWTQGTGSMTSYSFNTVYYANGIWVAGSSNYGLWWSTDGKAWTQGTGSMTSYLFYTVYYVNGIWVAGSGNRSLWWSTDGKAWIQVTGPTASYTFSSVYYANGIWVAGSVKSGLWWSGYDNAGIQ